MTYKLDDRVNTLIAMPNSITSGALVATKVNATGYGRARFMFTFGQPLANASLGAAGIWQATTSGGPFTLIAGASLAGISSGAISDQVAILDTIVTSATPWLQISGTISTSNIYSSAVVELYSGTRLNAPTSSAQQVVQVG